MALSNAISSSPDDSLENLYDSLQEFRGTREGKELLMKARLEEQREKTQPPREFTAKPRDEWGYDDDGNYSADQRKLDRDAYAAELLEETHE
jgi:hypothetical protein